MNDRSKALVLPEPVLAHVKAAQRKFSTIAKRSGGLVNWPTESQFAQQLIAKSEQLQKCVPQSITDAIINVAAIGLSLNPQRKHCALIPRWDSRLRMLVCNADPMYQGLIAIGTANEAVLDVRCELVRDLDVREGNFHYQGGTSPSVSFSPSPFYSPEQRGAIVGAFCVVQVRDANPHVTFMRIEEIVAIRDKFSEAWKYKVKVESEAKDKGKTAYQYGGPWEDSFEEMCKKTVLKRSAKYWPRRSERMDHAMALSDQADGTITSRETDIESTAVELITKTQLEELEELLADSHVPPAKVLNRFKIEKLADLPRDEHGRCTQLLKESKLIYVLRHATPETEIYADDWGITYEVLEGKAANEQSRAKLLVKRRLCPHLKDLKTETCEVCDRGSEQEPK